METNLQDPREASESFASYFLCTACFCRSRKSAKSRAKLCKSNAKVGKSNAKVGKSNAKVGKSNARIAPVLEAKKSAFGSIIDIDRTSGSDRFIDLSVIEKINHELLAIDRLADDTPGFYPKKESEFVTRSGDLNQRDHKNRSDFGDQRVDFDPGGWSEKLMEDDKRSSIFIGGTPTFERPPHEPRHWELYREVGFSSKIWVPKTEHVGARGCCWFMHTSRYKRVAKNRGVPGHRHSLNFSQKQEISAFKYLTM